MVSDRLRRSLMFIALTTMFIASSGGATDKHSYVAPPELCESQVIEYYKHPAHLTLRPESVDSKCLLFAHFSYYICHLWSK